MAKLSERTLKKLNEAIHKRENPERIAFADLFTLGLYLITQEKENEGFKACRAALLCIPIEDSFFDEVMHGLKDNIKPLSMAACAHSEFSGLLEI
ncbi:MAG: hypothetical protein WCH57_06225 [Verrucomicrobiota bacterium]